MTKAKSIVSSTKLVVIVVAIVIAVVFLFMFGFNSVKNRAISYEE
jgi:preprotein translocase subunit SecE